MSESKSPITRVRLLVPSEEYEFERLVVAVAKKKFRSEHFQPYGRRGQTQHGIDVRGREDDNPLKSVVLQAKCYDPKFEYSVGAIRTHVEKAKKGEVPFSTFIWATTLSRDAAMQKEADVLSTELSTVDNPVNVLVWSWGEFTDFAHDDDAIMHLITGNHPQHETPKRAIEIDESENAVASALTIEPVTAQQFAQLAQVAADYSQDGRLGPLWETLSKQALKTPCSTLKIVQDTLAQEQNLSAVDISRAKGLMGNCYLALSEWDEATRLYVEAYNVTPKRTASIANYALALGLREQFDELQRLTAEELIDESADNSKLAFMAFHFLKDLSLIPERYHSDDKIKLDILELERTTKGFEETVAELREIKNRLPEDIRAREALASFLLDRVISGEFKLSSQDFGEDRRGDLDECETIYRELWQEISGPSYEEFLLDISIPHNYSVALRIGGKFKDACAVLAEAFKRRSQSPALALQYGICLLEIDGEISKDVLEALDESADARRVKMRHAIDNGEWVEAITQLDVLDEIGDASERGFLLGIRHIAEVNQLSGEAQQEKLDDVLSNASDDVRELVMLTQLARRFGKRKAEEELYDRAVLNFNEGDEFISRIALAHEARHHDDNDTIFRLLEDHIDYSRNTEQLQLLCEISGSEFPIRERGRRVYAKLSDSLKALPRYQYYEAVFLENSDDAESARRLWSKLYEVAPDLRSWIGLWRTSAKLGDAARQKHLLKNDPMSLKGNLHEGMELAHILWLSGKAEEAVSVAERTIRSPGALKSPHVTARFTTFFLGRDDIVIENSEVVEVGAYVEFSSKNGDSLEGVIGSESDMRWGKALNSENRVVKQALGRRKGETFTVSNAMQDVEWTINEIQSELLRIIRYVPSVHEMDFGDDALIFNMSMPDNDVSAVIDIVRRGGERRDNLVNTIIERNIPLAFAAELNRTGPLSLAGAFEMSGRDFPTSVGLSNIFLDAYSVAMRSKDGIVIDSVTIQTAMRVGVLEELAHKFGPVRVSAMSMKEMREKVLELKQTGGGERMTLAAQGEQVFRDVIEKDDLAALIEKMESDLRRIEELCEIENVVFPDTENEALALLMSNAPLIASIISLSLQHQIPILSEDRNLRAWVKGLSGQDGFWLNPALKVMRDEETYSNESYAKAVAGFSALRHRHVSIDGQVLCDAFDLSVDNEISPEFHQLCNELGGENADAPSHANVAVYALNHVLLQDGLSYIGKQAASHLIGCILAGACGVRFREILSEVYSRSPRHVQAYISEYMAGHFYYSLLEDKKQ